MKIVFKNYEMEKKIEALEKQIVEAKNKSDFSPELLRFIKFTMQKQYDEELAVYINAWNKDSSVRKKFNNDFNAYLKYKNVGLA